MSKLILLYISLLFSGGESNLKPNRQCSEHSFARSLGLNCLPLRLVYEHFSFQRKDVDCKKLSYVKQLFTSYIEHSVP